MTAEDRTKTKGAWELHAALRTVVENHWCIPRKSSKNVVTTTQV